MPVTQLRYSREDCVGVCRPMYMGFAAFFGVEKRFPVDRTDLEIYTRWRYDWCLIAGENCQNLRKWVQYLCAPLRPFRSEMKENFYDIILPHVL